MDFLPAAFDAMASYSQFIVYVLVPSKTRPGKFDKFPVDYRTGQVANAHDPTIWTTPTIALKSASHLGPQFGLGFVFTKDDPFFFLDIDDCLEPCNSKWNTIAQTLLSAFQGAAVEVSSSGRGLHIIAVGNSPEHGCKNTSLKLELYTEGRFVALTGTHAIGASGADATETLKWLVQHYFTSTTPSNFLQEWTDKPVAEWRGNVDDKELLDRMLRSKSSGNVFGGRASFKDLWEANIEALLTAYPAADREHGYDESSADAALAQHLCFWTGNNCERILKLMQASGLSREKWNREDYLPRTIRSACGRQKEWLCDKPPELPTSIEATVKPDSPRANRVQGNTFLTADQQETLFAGCVYVSNEHKVLIPGGYLLNAERFKVIYGGYTLTLDNENQRTTKNAFEAFTESQVLRHPKAHMTCFRPDITPGTIIEKDGQRLVNIYYPVLTPRVAGDVSPVLRHLDKMIVDDRDRTIFVSYMAALVQYKGIKFQWAPVLQGVEGNGKTLFTRCVAFAIGDRYTHFPKAAEMSSKFNGWLYGNVFIAVEDIYLQANGYEVMEALKPMMTGERQEIQRKGYDQVTQDICANFIINTNHKDGLRKSQNDRRFAPFYTAQQSVSDLKRDGMTGDYFPDLYNWLGRKEGYAKFNEYLSTYTIPDEFNPAKDCHRAPITTSTQAAIEHNKDSIEQEVIEAIEQGLLGFKNGWVSSIALDRLLTNLKANRRIPLNKRRELMQSLGYDWHPGLDFGRVHNIVMPDGGKPRLYILKDHADRSIRGNAQISKAYEDSQK